MLKKLELQGFKSFAGKTILEFPSAITAIVGPNGSGKSNLVDAIRWVLGEQSLKNIRLGRSEDVLFAGTHNHPPSGFAEVSLSFDNSKKIFPEDMEEISVGRKLYRDGASSYILNRQEVRLKDTVRLMASAKLGTKGLAIIMQGSGDAFLNAPGRERREMLEEVLGLKEYRLKKEEAGRKLEETKSNLEKAASLMGELAPHLRSLKRQVGRWQRRKEKAEELRALEEGYFHFRLRQILEGKEVLQEKESVEKEIRELEAGSNELEAKLSELENSSRGVRSEDEELSLRTAALSEKRFELLRKLGNIEGRLETMSREVSVEGPLPPAAKLFSFVKNLRIEIGNLLEMEDVGEIKQKLGLLLREMGGFFEEIEGKEIQADDAGNALFKEKEALSSELSELGAAIEKVSQEARNARELAIRSGEEFRKIVLVVEEKRRSISEKRALLQEYRLEGEKRRLQEEDLRGRMEEAGWNFDDFLRAYAERPVPAGTDPAAEPQIFRLRRELADIGQVDEELVSEFEATQRRHDFLNSQKTDLEKALGDLERLSEELQKKIDREFSRALKDISDQFQHYFRLIFGGGSAGIREIRPKSKEIKQSTSGAEALRHEDELAGGAMPEPEEEGDLAVEVGLPRKKIKSLDMLSGGERALTSIALIFAVVGISAPPFLVLDEIDAALDEENSRRFSVLLKELASKTQFILITHNRATMEVADVLYGVSIQDSVSQIFAVKFEEAEKIAATDIHPVAG